MDTQSVISIQATAQSPSIQCVIAFPGSNAYSLLMNPIMTRRLRLVPATANHVRLEIESSSDFFRQLEVKPIPDRPSENLAGVLPFFLDQLENDPSLVGWMAWYWIHEAADGNHLVGGGGFKGAPANGMVEIGYETRPAFRRQGFATEAVGAEVSWALKHLNVNLVVAETKTDNQASIAVLRKLGFAQTELGSEIGLLRFEQTRSGQ